MGDPGVPVQHLHKCDLCEQQFKREDHLARHKLSHGKANFRCSYPGCEMTFHRKDVLVRHEKVHQPNSTIRRRRPRRGVEPKPFIQAEVLPQDADQVDVHFTDRSLTQSPNSETASHSSKNQKDAFSGLPTDDILFCALHWSQACMKRFPFIHHTSLDMGTMVPEKLLAIATLGGSGIPDYMERSSMFFERAKRLLKRRQDLSTVSDASQQPVMCATAAADVELSLFQAQVLLIEYTLWCNNPEDKKWARECAFRLAVDVVPRVVAYLKDFKYASVTWTGWVRQEQYIRLLWAFYCSTQKARVALPVSFSTLDVHCGLWLPGSNSAFNAKDEHTWRAALDSSIIRTPTAVISFNTAFYTLMSNRGIDEIDEDVIRTMRPLGQHVLLSAILDQYMNALTLPSNYLSCEAYREQSLSQFTPRVDYLNTLAMCRRFWWKDPDAVFKHYPPDVADLQNVLLLAYLELLLYGGRNGSSVPRDEYLVAVSVAISVFCALLTNGIFRVATKACWSTDGAARFHVVECARVMIYWVRSLHGYHNVLDLDYREQELYKQTYEALLGFYHNTLDQHPPPESPSMENLDKATYEAWSMIFGLDDWEECTHGRWPSSLNYPQLHPCGHGDPSHMLSPPLSQ